MKANRLLPFLWALAAGLTGCGSEANSGSGTMPTFWNPGLLYLKADSCSRLVVEIDTVEGTEIPAGTVETIRDVLSTYCDKPEGITFIRERPIPLSEARRKDPHLVALENVDGPLPRPGVGPPAFLYFLFYDSRKLGLSKPHNPHVIRWYPCAIYCDVAYQPFMGRSMYPAVIRHEIGHILGLCRNADHGDGTHCNRRRCVMDAVIGVPMAKALLKQPHYLDYCEACKADLLAARNGTRDARLRFAGQTLIRQEKEYWVSYLPQRVAVSFSPPWSVDGNRECLNAQREFRDLYAQARKERRDITVSLVQLREKPACQDRCRAIYDILTADADTIVAAWAGSQLKALNKAATKPAATTQAATTQGVAEASRK
ncbi:MAG TPA: hypothetical protein VM389_07595 [Phycisphaerae bacterium]|nr:hypothetical protein [Phycisphaerae bacterium]